MYQPVRTRRSFQGIVAQIEGLITSGQLGVGERLPSERELAEHFQVSRVVVREALRDLQARGIVEVRQGSGAYVQMIPSEALTRSLTLLLKLEKPAFIDLMIARRALEVATAPLAAAHGSPQQFDSLRECLAEMGAVAHRGLHLEDNFYEYGHMDLRLHLLVAEASQNAILETLSSAVLPLIMEGRFEVVRRVGSFDQFLSRGALRELHVHREHVEIVAAILNRDTADSGQLMEAHINRAIEVYGGLGG
jgi:GntR family L-lactate dehydrogenase operon transcriptional regulator